MLKRIAATEFIMKALALTLVLASSALSETAQAASATWNVNTDGSWNVDTNWTPQAAPGSTSSTTNPDTATFGNIITAARTVTVDTNRNIFGIDFSSSNFGYTLSGGSILLTNGGFIQTSGSGNRIDNVNSSVTIQGDGGTASFTANGTNNTASLRIGGTVAGVSTAGNTTTLTLNGTGTSTLNQISGQISDGTNSGKLALTKSGTGTWALTGSTVNAYTGKTTVSAGTLLLNKNVTVTAISSTGSSGSSAANTDLQVLSGGTVQWGARDQIVNTAKVGLSGGTLALNGNLEGTRSTVGVGSLTLSANSIIDLASTSLIHFAASGGQTWSGTLSIYNWSGTLTTGGGAEALLFGTNASSTSLTQTQLDSISFYSDSGTTFLGTGMFAPTNDGEVIPVPEPSTWVAGALALVIIGYRFSVVRRAARRRRAMQS